jgi:hypothetical protein
MQISRVPLFIFVEGYKDRYVYDQIVQSECQRAGVSYKIVAAEEIGISGGGKEALLKFFEYLAMESSLICDFNGKTTISIFFLDKDVDDILNTMRSSEHIVYTETYEIENYFFIHGELSEVAAASASLEVQSIRTILGDYGVWRRRAATKWKNWVRLCLFSKTCGFESISNYGLLRSPINARVCGPVKRTEYERYLSDLQNKSHLPPDEFKRSFERLCRKVDRIYSAGQHDHIFKGRWYACFLVEDIKRVAARRRFNSEQLETKLLSGLALKLNYCDPWAEHFRAPIRRLIDRVGM